MLHCCRFAVWRCLAATEREDQLEAEGSGLGLEARPVHQHGHIANCPADDPNLGASKPMDIHGQPLPAPVVDTADKGCPGRGGD